MKNFLIFSLLALISSNVFAESFYDFKYNDTSGNPVTFDSFKGKIVLVVNIATRCGFTGQLAFTLRHER